MVAVDCQAMSERGGCDNLHGPGAEATASAKRSDMVSESVPLEKSTIYETFKEIGIKDCHIHDLKLVIPNQLRRTGNKPKKPFTCPVEGCHKRYTKSNALWGHAREFEPDDKRHEALKLLTSRKCSNCEFRPEASKPMWPHLQDKHRDIYDNDRCREILISFGLRPINQCPGNASARAEHEALLSRYQIHIKYEKKWTLRLNLSDILRRDVDPPLRLEYIDPSKVKGAIKRFDPKVDLRKHTYTSPKGCIGGLYQLVSGQFKDNPTGPCMLTIKRIQKDQKKRKASGGEGEHLKRVKRDQRVRPILPGPRLENGCQHSSPAGGIGQAPHPMPQPNPSLLGSGCWLNRHKADTSAVGPRGPSSRNEETPLVVVQHPSEATTSHSQPPDQAAKMTTGLTWANPETSASFDPMQRDSWYKDLSKSGPLSANQLQPVDPKVLAANANTTTSVANPNAESSPVSADNGNASDRAIQRQRKWRANGSSLNSHKAHTSAIGLYEPSIPTSFQPIPPQPGPYASASVVGHNSSTPSSGSGAPLANIAPVVHSASNGRREPAPVAIGPDVSTANTTASGSGVGAGSGRQVTVVVGGDKFGAHIPLQSLGRPLQSSHPVAHQLVPTRLEHPNIPFFPQQYGLVNMLNTDAVLESLYQAPSEGSEPFNISEIEQDQAESLAHIPGISEEHPFTSAQPTTLVTNMNPIGCLALAEYGGGAHLGMVQLAPQHTDRYGQSANDGVQPAASTISPDVSTTNASHRHADISSQLNPAILERKPVDLIKIKGLILNGTIGFIKSVFFDYPVQPHVVIYFSPSLKHMIATTEVSNREANEMPWIKSTELHVFSNRIGLIDFANLIDDSDNFYAWWIGSQYPDIPPTITVEIRSPSMQELLKSQAKLGLEVVDSNTM